MSFLRLLFEVIRLLEIVEFNLVRRHLENFVFAVHFFQIFF